MKLTNTENLPQPIYDAIANDPYTKGDADISVTDLCGPARKRVLEERHVDELEDDASNRVWSLFGKAVHSILESANKTGIAERRLSIQIEGWKISGGMDIFYQESGLLQDYKTTSVYSFKNAEVKPDYEKQLNCYAEILRQNRHPVKRLEVIGFLKDWSPRLYEQNRYKNPYFPKKPVVTREVRLWSPEKAQAFLLERVLAHQEAKDLLPFCTPDERWAKPAQWALMKKGRKSALKLFDNEEDAVTAKEFANRGLAEHFVEFRKPSVGKRCEEYCLAAPLCSQFQQLKREEKRRVIANEDSE